MQHYIDGYVQHVANSSKQGFKPMRFSAFVQLAIRITHKYPRRDVRLK